MDYNELIETYLEQEIDILKRIDVSAVNEVLNLLEAGMKREATIYVFGNGVIILNEKKLLQIQIKYHLVKD